MILKVPEITVFFWIVKLLSTAMGESTSDFLVFQINPYVAVVLGCAAFAVSLAIQLWVRRYIAWVYWLAVVMVAVFGTMAADVLHVVMHIPYAVSTAFFSTALVIVFVVWYLSERTLSIHTINAGRRELFYWAAVVATFAMGTAVGDLTAVTFHLGYLGSLALFIGVIAIPALGYRWLAWNAVFAFWFAYVITRPLGASFADWLGKPTRLTGLGFGDGNVALILTGLIVVLVAYLAITRRDVQAGGAPVPDGELATAEA